MSACFKNVDEERGVPTIWGELGLEDSEVLSRYWDDAE
jgi:hypothetical protein